MNNYEQRTIARLLRHVPGVTIAKPTPTSMYHNITVDGVTARALVGDGHIVFGVRHYRHVDGLWDGGWSVVPVRRSRRGGALLGAWFKAHHTQAATFQRESAERAANYARERAALPVPAEAS